MKIRKKSEIYGASIAALMAASVDSVGVIVIVNLADTVADF